MPRSDSRLLDRSPRRLPDFLISILAVGACTAISIPLRSHLALTNFAMVYLLGVTLVSVRCDRAAAILCAFLSVTAFYYFCVPVRNSFVLEDSEYLITLTAMLTVALVISTLTVKVRAQATQAVEREKQTRALYELSRELSKGTDVLDAARTATLRATEVFDADAEVFLPDARGVIARRANGSLDNPIPEDERVIAQSVLDTGHSMTKTIGSGRSSYPKLWLPLTGSGPAMAVMSLVPNNPIGFHTPDRLHLLGLFCSQTAAVMERAQSAAAARDAEVEVQAERTRNALLSAVSHDIKTPLSSIYGAATSLLEEEGRLSAPDRRELVESIADEAERLNRVVTNLLEMTRLDAGLKITRDWHPIEEIVGAALTQLEKPLRGRRVTINIPAELPLVCVDDVLLEHVIVNLLENVIKYTPEGTPVAIGAFERDERMIVSVRDYGAGFSPGDEERVFEKFYRGKTGGVRGVGLGLAICRAIISAHQGVVSAENQPGGGAVVKLELPIGGIPPAMGTLAESAFQ